MSFELVFNKEYELSDLVDFVNDKIHSTKVTLDTYISTDNMIVDRGGVEVATKLPSALKYNHFKVTDTLFSNIRTYFRKVWLADFEGGASPDVLIFRTKNPEILDPTYLYYLLSDKKFSDYTVLTSKGAKMPRGDKAAIMQYKVYLPEPDTQKNIGLRLSQLDKKLIINTQTNQTLEQMAQAIFKSWFVDFDPVKAKMNGEQPEGMDAATASLFPEKLVESELGLIPEGWEVGTLNDVAKYCSARANTDTITFENYISTENMLAEKKGITVASRLPTAKTVAAYKSGDILVSNIRPYFKKIWLAEGNGGRSNDVLGFESVSLNTAPYLMNLLYQDTFFEYMTRTSKGAKMPRGDKKAIMDWEMAVPPVELREAFSSIVDKFYQLIPQNRAQNVSLESLRDTLLPKLLSGEIELDTK